MAISTTTVRLPDELKAESEAYASSLGISLNALMAVALRDYLDSRSKSPVVTPSSGPSSLPEKPVSLLRAGGPVESLPDPSGPIPASVSAAPVVPGSGVVYRRPVAGNSAPCPCGARKPPYFDYPLKWRECHGRKEKS